MKFFVALVACFALASAAPSLKKAHKESSKLIKAIPPMYAPSPTSRGMGERIVGGSEASRHQFPHQAALYINGGSFCGGSLISDEWVLTAGHCTVLASGANRINVVLGAHDLQASEPSQVTIQSKAITTHERYNSFNLHNDIGLVQLSEKVSLVDGVIETVALAENADPAVGDIVTLSGWGKNSDSAPGVTDKLRMVDAPIISNAQCRETYGNTIYDGTICISSAGGKGVCSGDSGGPMNWNGMSAAVTSFVASAGCESGLPHGFTRVSYFRDWIRTNSGV